MIIEANQQQKQMLELLVQKGLIKKNKFQYATRVSLNKGQVSVFDQDVSKDPFLTPLLPDIIAH